MAKFGDTKGRRFGSEAGKQRIRERRERMEEVRKAPNQQVPKAQAAEGEGESKKRSNKRR